MKNNDLISRSALLAAYDVAHKGPPGGARKLIEEAPAVDVEPMKHGWWERSKIPHEKYFCSECGGACWYYDYEAYVAKSRYCPNCGAKMDGEKPACGPDYCEIGGDDECAK